MRKEERAEKERAPKERTGKKRTKRVRTNKERGKDPRVTAPLLSWKTALILFGIVYILILIQAVIFDALWDHILAMAGVLLNYVVCVCILLTVLVGLFWRYVIGRMIRRIAAAAQKVAAGDFSVQVESGRKDGKKNEIDVLIEDFNKMIRELAGNEMLKSDFIANVSHEIKTPLSVIQSYSKAIKDGCDTPEQQEKYIDTVIEASEKLNAMITNILKLSKLENQQIFPEPETYQLGEQLRWCALGFMEKWQEKDIGFEINVADVVVHYDMSLLELVWNNLLSNAVKFTDRGGHISLTSEVKEDVVYVTVRDSGCGMDQETTARVFEKFYQGDTSHAAEGNGLGLALAKKVVDIAGGKISVESAPGEGTAFTVELDI